ncbi:hypothetical protein ONE63_001993 [Megalurothrips usitatus]|uniref:Zinc transporter ZIP1-like n=1 Tax=Megalurothrips usitatus TaxID=439358 RepID=A0AAV7XB46_9NEOP|nr:hypothetical protein ONE63_001993 [Megalurothrips usitatus]
MEQHDHAGHHHHDHDHHHHAHNGTDPLRGAATAAFAQQQQDLITAKVVAMVVLGVVSFLIGVLPVKLAKWCRFGEDVLSGRRALVISLLLCFGGGVLLYTTFVHLQPEVRQGFEALREAGKLPQDDMQLSELTFCAGFFLVYIVEELVHLVLDGRSAEDEHDDKDVVAVHRTMSLRRCKDQDGQGQHHSNIGGPNQMIPRAILAPGSPAKQAPLETVTGSLGHAAMAAPQPRALESARKSITASTEGLLHGGSHLGSTASFPAPDAHDAHPHGHHHHHHHHLVKDKVMSKSIRGFLTVLALSFHAVFEGLAVGLESSPGNVWYLFGAIATHKFVIALCVGVELVSSRTRASLILIYVATFAAVSPVGIAAGLLLGAEPGAGEGVAAVVLQGMAAGTLLYVVFFEILQRERTNNQSGVCQLLAIMAGFGVMMALGMACEYPHTSQVFPPPSQIITPPANVNGRSRLPLACVTALFFAYRPIEADDRTERPDRTDSGFPCAERQARERSGASPGSEPFAVAAGPIDLHSSGALASPRDAASRAPSAAGALPLSLTAARALASW